jgi:hypothetical protein
VEVPSGGGRFHHPDSGSVHAVRPAPLAMRPSHTIPTPYAYAGEQWCARRRLT